MIKFDHVITNGYIGIETIEKRTENGWTFVTTLPAKTVHPHALETDKVTIFSKYSRSE